MKLLSKDGSEIEQGSVITWNVWDSDDFTTWKFVGIVRQDHVLYLGGGIDFGAGIGQKITFEDVIDQSEDNDPYDVGITVIGKQSKIPHVLLGMN